ncbi:MAG: arginine N-succinyltransferase, partial [Aeromonas sp.]
GIGKKRFIAELMPKYPIYINLLSKEARAVIGQTHDKTRPAIKMLQDEGFVNRGYVDIFDAGPTVECDVKNIRSVRRSKKLRVLVGEPIGGRVHLICNSRFEQYRACYGNARVDLDKHEVIIPPKMAAALKVQDGDMVRAVDLD